MNSYVTGNMNEFISGGAMCEVPLFGCPTSLGVFGCPDQCGTMCAVLLSLWHISMQHIIIAPTN